MLNDPAVDSFKIGDPVKPNVPNEPRWHHKQAMICALNRADGEVGVHFKAKNMTASTVWFRPFEIEHRK